MYRSRSFIQHKPSFEEDIMGVDNGFQFAIGGQQDYDENGRPWYDTKQGVEDSLSTLAGFSNLISERRMAGYERKERLNEFYVLGRYSLDTCGNCGKMMEWIPKENIPHLPDVMTRDEFWAYVKENVKDAENVSVSIGMGSDLPWGDIVCPVCKKGWTIHDCHDTVVARREEVLPLADFIGKTLSEVKASYATKKDAHYRMQSDILIRNDKHINLALKPGYTTLKENEGGWLGSRDGITNEYVIQDGDDGFFNVWSYYHSTCNHLYRAFKEEKNFRDIFAKAGFIFPVFHHLPNGYSSRGVGAPWFRVETEIGTITLGWRKRVVNIDWSELPC
ncbi:MAG: hypothetical protein WC823_05315, partial [Parcubacteria group bacterium]